MPTGQRDESPLYGAEPDTPQPSIHLLFSQICPRAQSACARHPGVHFRPTQMLPAPQVASCLHPATQFLVSQMRPLAQRLSTSQPATQRICARSQRCSSGQLALERHPGRHTRVLASQSSPALAQLLSVSQPSRHTLWSQICPFGHAPHATEVPDQKRRITCGVCRLRLGSA